MKTLIAIAIAIVPFTCFRIFFYNTLLGYNISYTAKVFPLNFLLCNSLKVEGGGGFYGYFNIIKDVNKFNIGKNAKVRSFNRFQNFDTCTLQEDALIVSKNEFFGTSKNISPFKDYENIVIGSKTIITRGHSFDLSDEIIIGKDVTFGGSGIQVWTHGFDLEHTKIQASVRLGDNCYVGSRSLIMPGVQVCDSASFGAGTIVSKSVIESGFYTSSNLVKRTDLKYYKENEEVAEKNGSFFYRKKIV